MCYVVFASGRALQGAPGAPIEIPVPFGVTVKTDFGTVLGTTVHSFLEHDHALVYVTLLSHYNM